MGKLINDLLYLAQSEDGRSDSLDFDLGKLIVETTTSMEAVLYEKNIHFSQNIQEGVLVHADEGKIGQALVILLDNAAKYTEEEGWILITMSKDKGWAKVSVQNSGQGIAPQDLPNIFDRFYRPDQSRSTESGGYGLGLSIFRAIIERSGGRVSVRSADKVTEFSFTLKSEK
jgi:signal transduction histidine kinase